MTDIYFAIEILKVLTRMNVGTPRGVARRAIGSDEKANGSDLHSKHEAICTLLGLG